MAQEFVLLSRSAAASRSRPASYTIDAYTDRHRDQPHRKRQPPAQAWDRTFSYS